MKQDWNPSQTVGQLTTRLVWKRPARTGKETRLCKGLISYFVSDRHILEILRDVLVLQDRMEKTYSVSPLTRSFLKRDLWMSFQAVIISIKSLSRALGFCHEAVKAKQAEWLSSPRPGRVAKAIGNYQGHLAVPCRWDLNPLAPPLDSAPESHVWSERMTPPLSLQSSYRPHSSSTECQTRLDRIS